MRTKAFIVILSAISLFCACGRNQHKGESPDNPEPIPFTSRIEQGVYSVTDSDSKAISTFPSATSQYIKSTGRASESVFRMIDFTSHTYLELTLAGTAFAEGGALAYTVASSGITSAPQGGSELKIVQMQDNMIWAEDKSLGIGYIFSK